MAKLILSANAVPRIGGQGLNLQHMIEALGPDFELTVFCRGSANDGATYRSVPESRRSRLIGGIPVLRRRRDWATWYCDVDFDRQVAAALPKTDVFQGATGQSLESLQAARRRGALTVLDSVTAHIGKFGEVLERECASFGVRPPLSAALRRRIEQEYHQADVIRVMSEVSRQTFLNRGISEDKVVVASPPFCLDEFPQAEFRESVFRICFVGLIEPWKGFHYLVEAFEGLAVADSELVLWGGPGARPITRYFEQHTRRNQRIIVRPVPIRQAGLGVVYGESSVLVLPSLCDGFGYVVGEAMACGLPVIVTSATGAADLVQDGVNGYVVPPADAGAIRDRLQHLATRPALVRSLGAAARETMRGATLSRFRCPLLSKIREGRSTHH
jgi:glycosyltransferase involved in cell wall biosynthesis